MPLTRKTTGVEKTKRETGSIDKVRINDDSVQVLTSEGKIYVLINKIYALLQIYHSV